MINITVHALSGEVLSISVERETIDDIKNAIKLKYRYPLEQQYIHHNGRFYIMAQICSQESVDISDSLSCPFIKEFANYGCPEKLIEALYLRGFNKQEIYERLLPNMNYNQLYSSKNTEESENKKNRINISDYVQFLNYLDRPVFNEDEFLELVEQKVDCVKGIDYEEYCSEAMEFLKKRNEDRL